MLHGENVERELSKLNDMRIPLPSGLNPPAASLALLELQLQQILCMLHISALQQPSIGITSASFSSSGFLTFARRILRLHTELVGHGKRCLLLSQGDTLRIVTACAFVAKTLAGQRLGHSPEHSAGQWSQLMEEVFVLEEEKLFLLGFTQSHILLTFAIADYIGCEGDPSDVQSYKGVGRAIAIQKKMFEAQDPAFEAEVAKRKSTQTASIDATGLSKVSLVQSHFVD